MIRGAIFDVDGTLLDSMPIWRDAGARYLARRGVQPEPTLAATLFYMSFEEGVSYIRRRYGLPESPEDIERGITEVIADFYRQEVALKPGAADFLAKLADKGVAMVIATSGEASLAGAALERLGVARYFQRIITCTELFTTKHDPWIYRASAAYLDTEPEETLVFEDALHAVRTARRAGFPVVAVADAESAEDWDTICARATFAMQDFTDFDACWRAVTESVSPSA